MSEQVEGYVSVQEAARKLGRSTEQVRRYLREGKMEGHRIGRQWFIREPTVLYQTRPQEGEKVGQVNPEYPGRIDPLDEVRLRAIERIARRREVIGQRWERLGVQLDPVELIREVREEEP